MNNVCLEPPDPPVNLEVVEVGSRAVRLSWRPPFDGHSKLLGYTVQYKASSTSGRSDITDWQHANSLNLSIATVENSALTMGYDCIYYYLLNFLWLKYIICLHLFIYFLYKEICLVTWHCDNIVSY